jgi:hypothetical protein
LQFQLFLFSYMVCSLHLILGNLVCQTQRFHNRRGDCLNNIPNFMKDTVFTFCKVPLLLRLVASNVGVLAWLPIFLLEFTDFTVNRLLGDFLERVMGCLLRLGEAFMVPLAILEMGLNSVPILASLLIPCDFHGVKKT